MKRRGTDDIYKYADLARYNAEVYHGIVHTPEYDAKMAEQQARFDAELQVEIKASKVVPL